MKKNILSVLLLGATVFSATASAKNDSFDSSSMSIVESQLYQKKMIAQCGHARDVSDSSVFGSKEQHEKIYPGIGTFSAEVDNLRTMDRQSYATVNEIFRQAKSDKDELRLGIGHNKNMLDRHMPSISLNKETLESTGSAYNQVQRELLQREAYVMSKAVGAAKGVMENDGRRSRGPNDVGKQSSYDMWKQCQQWWAYEGKLNPWD